MKNFNLFALLATSAAALAMGGCSSSNGTTPGDGGMSDVTTDSMGADGPSSSDSPSSGDSPSTTDGPTEGAAPNPKPPALGMQIDRMGRPAVNTALNHVFDPSALTAGTTKGMAKDAYNQDSLPGDWAANVPEFAKNLAIFDGLDGVCKNQPAYGAFGLPGYTALAGVLSNDALWLNTAGTTCNTYLAEELGLLGIANNDCGGRTPTENVIDVTYNVVAGTLVVAADAGAPGPVTNGITAPAVAPSATFPYFAAAQ